MPQAEGRFRPWRDHRYVVEAIVFRYRTGVAWRDLAERFGRWQMFWADGTAVRGAPPLREEVVRPQRTKNGKESTHSSPL
jgi:transposase